MDAGSSSRAAGTSSRVITPLRAGGTARTRAKSRRRSEACSPNTSINYDLPIGLIETCESFGVSPRDGSAEQRDYLHLNAILGETQEEVKKWLATGLLGVIDRALGRLNDVVASFSVVRAREAAWVHAKTLWQLRDQREVMAAYLETLDHTVGFAGRGLVRTTLLGIGGWASRREWLSPQARHLLGAPKLTS